MLVAHSSTATIEEFALDVILMIRVMSPVTVVVVGTVVNLGAMAIQVVMLLILQPTARDQQLPWTVEIAM